jgi:hypothetical protein
VTRLLPPSRAAGDKPIEQIGFAEIAQRASVSLAELRARHGSTLSILAAQMKEIDRAVLECGCAA